MTFFRKRKAGASDGHGPEPMFRDLGDGEYEVTAETLKGGGLVEVVGESFYYDNLRSIVGGGRAMNLPVVAALIAEPDNVNDPNAVGIYVNSLKVGHLSRNAARLYQPVLAHLASKGKVGACDGRISGSGEAYGVFLDLASPEACLDE